MRFSFIPVVTTLLLLSACAEVPMKNDYSQSPITSGDDAEPGSIHNLPVPAGVQAARDALAERLGVASNKILILTAFEKDWSDSCLGLGGPAESCLAAITPGYEVTMTYDGEEYRYRTNEDGSVVRAEE